MIKLNLTAETPEHDVLKAYLEENASPTLVEKIENGVKIVKDGKTLISKKDLAGFMKYACEEARKLAAKGATGACVKDDIVFGWLIHYFEEDSIEGTLYNEDGTPYKPPKKQTATTVQRKPATPVQAKPTPPKPAQFSLFDMLAENTPKEEPPVEDTEEPVVEDPAEEQDFDVDKETGEILPKTPAIKKDTNEIYQRYLKCMEITPNAVIAMRLGDFYEIYGDYAVDIANKVGLTLTSRDFGLAERTPMVGIPHHAADNYFSKISVFYNIMVVENEKSERVSRFIACTSVNGANFDDNDEDDEELTEEEMREFDGDFDDSAVDYDSDDENDLENVQRSIPFDKEALLDLLEIFGDEMMIAQEDI